MPERSDLGDFHMILRLRKRHRRIVIAMGVVLPVVFTLGVAARKPTPTVPSLPGETPNSRSGSAAVVWDRFDLFSKTAIRVRLFREKNGSGQIALKSSAPLHFVKPDLLVYWVAQSWKTTNTIPDNAVLLGAFSADSLLFSGKESNAEGRLLLFSLANQEIVAVSKPFSVLGVGHSPF
jgi:hypothetical protein